MLLHHLLTSSETLGELLPSLVLSYALSSQCQLEVGPGVPGGQADPPAPRPPPGTDFCVSTFKKDVKVDINIAG